MAGRRRGRERFPLHLIANQPSAPAARPARRRPRTARPSKVAGREPIRIHPDDAAARGIADGDVVRVFNDRGACLAGAVVTDDVRPAVVQPVDRRVVRPVDPADRRLCAHGNPNVLTADRGTSRLAQGSTGQHVPRRDRALRRRPAPGPRPPTAEVHHHHCAVGHERRPMSSRPG